MMMMMYYLPIQRFIEIDLSWYSTAEGIRSETKDIFPIVSWCLDMQLFMLPYQRVNGR